MNHNDYMKEFGIENSLEHRVKLIERQEQIEAMYREDLLVAKVSRQDRLWMAGIPQMRFVTRDLNYTLNVTLDITPICFTEN